MENAKYSAVVVANTILSRFLGDNKKITPMKLQKLLYITFKEYYSIHKIRLFNEPIEMWQYGPVVRSVYDEFKTFGAKGIDKFATDAKGNVYVCNEETDNELKQLLDDIVRKYYNTAGVDLSRKTHVNENSAWLKAYGKRSWTLELGDIENEASYL